MTQIWAHRGASAEAPENTLPAFALALGQGADGLECDVQLTRDDEVVVIHDETLERTTNGHGWVADHSLAELKMLDASSGKAGFSGVQIPTLGELLELVAADDDAVLNVELKTDQVPYRGIEERVLELVQASPAADRVIFSSFNHYTLRNLRRLGATQRLGALLSDRLFKPWRYVKRLEVEAIHPGLRACSAKLVEKSHERDLAVHVWTVDSPKDVRKQLSYGVDALITNLPAFALDLRDAPR